MSLKAAIRALRRLGARAVHADQLHFQSGGIAAASAPLPAAPPQSGASPLVGMIDGGVAGGSVVQRGFARAPRARAITARRWRR